MMDVFRGQITDDIIFFLRGNNIHYVLVPRLFQSLEFFFLPGFSFTNIHELQDCREKGRAFLQLLTTTSTRFTDT